MDDITRLPGVALCLLLAAAFPPAAFAVDDTYLQALEAEADSGSPAARRPDRSTPLRRELEQALQDGHPSSYHLYRRLSAEQRRQVAETYAQQRSLPAATRKIIELYPVR